MKKTIDMTKGSILGPVFIFAIPILIGNILQQLYTTVDTFMLGRYCNADSLAAVGTSAQPVELILCVFLGIGAGISILVAQYRGASDDDNLKLVVKTAISFTYIIAIPLMALGFVLGPLILKIMNTPPEAWDFACAYVEIILLASLGNIGYNINAGILRGMGDSTASLVFLAISCVVNIILDYVCIALLGLDVYGAAIATASAMVASWIFSVAYILKKYPEIKFTVFPRVPDGAMFKKILRVGIPLGLNNSLYSVGHIALQRLYNLQGTVFVAGCNVGSRLNGFSGMMITALSSAATTFAGQNFGARNYDRLRQGAYKITFANAFITFVAGIIMLRFDTQILGLFTTDAEVLSFAVMVTNITLPFQWLYCTLATIIAYINGAGQVRYSTVINILMLWAVRIPVAYMINYFYDGHYVMAAVPVSFVFGAVCMVAFLFTKKWRQVVRGEIVGD